MRISMHEALFPGHKSTLEQTDPELIELFDNFAFDEVVEHSPLDLQTRGATQYDQPRHRDDAAREG